MSYYLKAILLEDCNYSIAASKMINEMKINNDMIIVTNHNKHIYKTEHINTFPQLYLQKYNTKGSQLLGGYDDLKYTVDMFKGKPYDISKVEQFMNKYKWSKKATLRLIEIINL
jgi:hypothetical protein